MSYDAIIIGAGPAGCSTAISLRQAGWSVAIVEKSGFPRRKVCGEFLSASNLALVRQLGIADGWRANAGPEIRRVGFYSRETCVTAPMPDRGRGYGRALGRDMLDQLLLDAARDAGATIYQPWRATGVRRDGQSNAVEIEARDARCVLAAPVVIAAHGSWEPGRLPTQIERDHLPSDLLGFKAHFSGHGLAPELMPLLVFPGGYGGMVTTDHGRASVSLCIRRDALAELRQGGMSAGEAVRRHLMRSCRGVRDTLEHAVLEDRWLAAGPICLGPRTGYDRDIFRVGNLAGESHPIIAEGISMALQSGWMLASHLAKDSTELAARQRAGRAYSAAWSKQFAGRIRFAEIAAHCAMSPAGTLAMRSTVRLLPGALTLGAWLSGKVKPVPGLAPAYSADHVEAV